MLLHQNPVVVVFLLQPEQTPHSFLLLLTGRLLQGDVFPPTLSSLEFFLWSSAGSFSSFPEVLGTSRPWAEPGSEAGEVSVLPFVDPKPCSQGFGEQSPSLLTPQLTAQPSSPFLQLFFPGANNLLDLSPLLPHCPTSPHSSPLSKGQHWDHSQHQLQLQRQRAALCAPRTHRCHYAQLAPKARG